MSIWAAYCEHRRRNSWCWLVNHFSSTQHMTSGMTKGRPVGKNILWRKEERAMNFIKAKPMSHRPHFIVVKAVAFSFGNLPFKSWCHKHNPSWSVRCENNRVLQLGEGKCSIMCESEKKLLILLFGLPCTTIVRHHPESSGLLPPVWACVDMYSLQKFTNTIWWVMFVSTLAMSVGNSV